MATALPTYRRQAIPSGLGPTPRLEASSTGAALSNLAATGARVLEIKENEDASTWTANALSAAHVAWIDRLQKAQEEAPLGAAGFAGQIDGEFQQFKTDQLKNAPNEKSKRFFGERLDALHVTLHGRAVEFETRQGIDYRNDQWVQNRKNVASTAQKDPEAGRISLAESDAILKESPHKAWAADQATKLRDEVAVAAVIGMVERDPAAALKLLNKRFGIVEEATPGEPPATDGAQRIEITGKRAGSFFIEHLTPQQAHAMRNHAQTEVNRRTQEGRFDFNQRAQDVQALSLAGKEVPPDLVPSVEVATRLHGKDGPAIWQQQFGNPLMISEAIRAMRTASPEDRAKALAGAEPEVKQGFAGALSMYQAAERAKKAIEDAIVADPATYALQNSPRVQQAAAALAQVMGSAATFSSPEAKQRAQALTMQSYALTMNAEQLRLGVDTIRDEKTGNKPRGPRLLTNQTANEIVDQFNDQTQGGTKAAELVQGLEQQYGKHWPQVFGQLASNENNKLPPAALVIPNMQNDASRSRMAAVSVMKMDDLKALVKPTDPKDLRDSLLDQYAKAIPTFTAQGADGNRTLAVFLEQGERYGLSLIAEGMSASDAAKRTYQATMGWDKEFIGTYRVPISQKPKDVSAGAVWALRKVKPEAVQIYQGDNPPAVMTDDALRNRTMWITNGNETGLQLMAQSPDGGVYRVQTKDGKPVQYDWATLRSLAAASRTPDNMRQTDVEELRRRQQELNPRR